MLFYRKIWPAKSKVPDENGHTYEIILKGYGILCFRKSVRFDKLPLIVHEGQHFSICVQNLQFLFKITCFELLINRWQNCYFICSYNIHATNLNYMNSDKTPQV